MIHLSKYSFLSSVMFWIFILLRAVTEVRIRISCSHLHTLNNAIFAVDGKDFSPQRKLIRSGVYMTVNK